MSRPTLSDEALLDLARKVQAAGSAMKLAPTIGVAHTTIVYRLKLAARRGLIVLTPGGAGGSSLSVTIPGDPEPDPEAPDTPVLPEVPLAERERVRYEDEIRRLRKDLRDAHRDDLEAERVRELAFGLGRSTVEIPRWLVEPSGSDSGPGVPMTFWSDWHWGEVVRHDEMGGVNEYNTDIARARARRLVERTLDLTLRHMVSPSYSGIVVGLGGDMFSGDIHEELADTNGQTILESMVDLSEVLAWALTTIAGEFPEVHVPCVVGNHDRISSRPRFKNRVTTSYAWMLYQTLERTLRDRKVENVRFVIPRTFDCQLPVVGTRFLFTHGDSMGVKGGDGIIGSIGPIKRGVVKIMDQRASIGGRADVVVMGHWHTYLTLPGIIVNGSLKGYDEYAFGNRFRPEPPCQALWYVHPRHGITSHWPVYVEDQREPVAAEVTG